MFYLFPFSIIYDSILDKAAVTSCFSTVGTGTVPVIFPLELGSIQHNYKSFSAGNSQHGCLTVRITLMNNNLSSGRPHWDWNQSCILCWFPVLFATEEWGGCEEQVCWTAPMWTHHWQEDQFYIASLHRMHKAFCTGTEMSSNTQWWRPTVLSESRTWQTWLQHI